jgi:hypothetical protein
MKRWQSVRQYRRRGVSDDAGILINADECRYLLDDRRHLDETSRLILEIMVRNGDGVMTVRELKSIMYRAVPDAGTIKAAIRVLTRARKRRAIK